MRLYIFYTAVILLVLCPASACSSRSGSNSNLGAEITEEHDAIEVVSMIVSQDAEGLVAIASLAGDQDKNLEPLIHTLKNLQWGAEQPADEQDMQTAVYKGTKLRIDSRTGEFIKLLGKRYSEGDLDESSYTNTMRLFDGMLSGVLSSYEQIDDPRVDSLHSVLTHAALMRGVIALEFRAYDLRDQSVLNDEQIALLRDIARYQKYELLDQIP